MAIEWWTRVDQGFSIAELLESAAPVLDDVGFPGIELALTPEDVASEVIGSGRADIEFRISLANEAHSSTFGLQDFGDPDDPELGTWITVTPWRRSLIKRHSVEPAAPPAEKAQALLRSFQPRLVMAD